MEKETEEAGPIGSNFEKPEEHSDNSYKRYVECERCGKHIKNNPQTIKDHERYCIQTEILDTIDEIQQKTPKITEVELNPLEITDHSSPNLEDETEEQEADSNAGFFSDIRVSDIIVILGVVGALFAALVVIPTVKVTTAQKKQPDPVITEYDLALQALKNGPSIASSLPFPYKY